MFGLKNELSIKLKFLFRKIYKLHCITIKYMTTITTRLPDTLAHELQSISKDEEIDQSDVVRRLLLKGVQQWRIDKALHNYQEGIFSVGQAAHFAHISSWRFFDLLHEKKIPLNYDSAELARDLKTIQWKV